MKELPPKISQEIFLNVDYCILRMNKHVETYKIDQKQPHTFFTFKQIQEKNLPKQHHIHLRFNGKDDFSDCKDTIDIDIYIPINELSKLIPIIPKENEKLEK